MGRGRREPEGRGREELGAGAVNGGAGNTCAAQAGHGRQRQPQAQFGDMTCIV